MLRETSGSTEEKISSTIDRTTLSRINTTVDQKKTKYEVISMECPMMFMYMSIVRYQLFTIIKWNRVTIPLLKQLKFIR